MQKYIRNKKAQISLLVLCVFILAFFAPFLFTKKAHAAATYYAIASGNWNVNTTWSLTSGGGAVGVGVWPVAGDTVSIGEAGVARAVTIPSGYSAVCASIAIGNSSQNQAKSLTLADGTASLTVSGNIDINRPGGSNTTALNVNAGRVSVGGNATLAGTNTATNRIAKIAITTGTMSVSGDLVFITGSSASNLLTMSGGAGRFNLAGAFTVTDGTLAAGASSTFNFNGTAAQTIPIGVSNIVYYNLFINNTNVSGATLSAAVTSALVTGSIRVQTGVFNNGGFAIGMATSKTFEVAHDTTFNMTGTTGMVTGTTITKTFGSTSTTNYAGTAQTVSQETYGNLTFSGSGNKTTAALTTTVSGNWDVTGATALLSTNNSSVTVKGNIIGNGAITSGSGTISLQGKWTNTGTFTAGLGTVNYSKTTGGQTVGGLAYNNLTVNNNSGTDTAGGTISVGNALTTIAGGTLKMTAAYTLGGTLTTITNGGTISTAVPTSLSATPIATGKTWGGTIVYAATTGLQTVVAGIYNNLTLSNTKAIDSADGNLTVNGALATTAGGTLDMTAAYTLDGTLSTITNAGTINTSVPTSISLTPIPSGKTWGGTVKYAGATAQTVPIGTYNNLTFSAAGAKTTMVGTVTVGGNWNTSGGIATLNTNNTNVTVAGNISGAGAVTSGSGTITIAGNWTNGGTFTSGMGTVNFSGGGTQTIPARKYYNLTSSSTGARTLASSGTIGIAGAFTPNSNSYTITGSTVEFNGLSAQITGGTAFTTFNNLRINNSAGVSLAQSQAVNGALTLVSGNLVVGAHTLTIAGNSLTRTAGSINASNTSATLAFTNSSAITLPTSTFSAAVNNLTINGAGGVKASSDFTINGVLNLQSANPSSSKGSLDMGTHTLTMGASATTIGTWDVTGIVKRTALVAGTTYTFGNQYTTINFLNTGTLPTNISIKITLGAAPSWKTAAIQRTYEIVRAGGVNSFATLNLHYLDTELNGNTKNTLVKWADNAPFMPGTAVEYGRSNYDTTNNWVGIAGYDVSLFPTSFNQRIATLANSALSSTTWNGSVSIVWTNPNNWTPNGIPSDLADAVIPNASTTAFDPTLPMPTSALDRLTIQSGGILNGPISTGTLTLSGGSGAWSNNGGTFNPGTFSTVIFTNTNATISGITDFYNMSVNSGAGLQMSSGSTMRIAGTMTNSGTWLAAQLTGNTVEYNGANQTVLNPNGSTPGYDNLILSGNGTKTMPSSALSIGGNFSISGSASATAASALTIGGTVILGSGTTLIAGPFTHNVAGGWTNNDSTFTNIGSTINFNGTSSQVIGGSSATAFNNLTVNNSAGVTLNSVNPAVGGVLNLISGNITTGANNIYINSTGSVSRTSGHIVGNLRKYMATGATGKTFEIGDASNYAPAIISFGNITVAGDLMMSTIPGDHPNIGSSTIDELKTANRYWTTTNLGISFDNYSAVFNFINPGDLDGGATPANFIVGKWSGSSWLYPTVGTKTSASTQTTGLTSFGDFQLGETGVAANAPASSPVSTSTNGVAGIAVSPVTTGGSATTTPSPTSTEKSPLFDVASEPVQPAKQNIILLVVLSALASVLLTLLAIFTARKIRTRRIARKMKGDIKFVSNEKVERNPGRINSKEN